MQLSLDLAPYLDTLVVFVTGFASGGIITGLLAIRAFDDGFATGLAEAANEARLQVRVQRLIDRR